ncbi:hypothetical protein GGR55DRAFT_687199 [Xylaria sp. FL0064]|nr:hypothetical protein GGR55DRAFT_687199 [Xylaria sp. FL0064]
MGHSFSSARKRSVYKPPSWLSKPCVAVLYPTVDAPACNGVKKPRKPSGYQDSGADIAYVLREKANIHVVTPADSPDPQDSTGWCFPDHEQGIISAVEKCATHLWANTILFSSHPLQTSSRLSKYENYVRVAGQQPLKRKMFDDKAVLNDLLRTRPSLTSPRACTVSANQDPRQVLGKLRDAFPLVAKPDELQRHVDNLFNESPRVLVEEFLSGEEATVTVMRPGFGKPWHWSLPVVTRFNHEDNVAPYNDTAAVVANSRVISADEASKDPAYARVERQCETVAEIMNPGAPIRIDVRRFTSGAKSPFALFDVNLEIDITGPGRPGRSDQNSLTALAAAGLGCDYPSLLTEILDSAPPLHFLRHNDYVPLLLD